MFEINLFEKTFFMNQNNHQFLFEVSTRNINKIDGTAINTSNDQTFDNLLQFENYSKAIYTNKVHTHNIPSYTKLYGLFWDQSAAHSSN